MEPVDKSDLTPSTDGRAVVFAEDQPEYKPLPAMKFADGTVYTEWSPTPVELQTLMARIGAGERVKIRLWQWTFGGPLQPVAIEVV